MAAVMLHLPLMAQESQMVSASDIKPTSTLYVNNRAPLPANPFIKLAPQPSHPAAGLARCS